MDWLEIQGRVQGALWNLEALDVHPQHKHMKDAAMYDLSMALKGIRDETGVASVERAEP